MGKIPEIFKGLLFREVKEGGIGEIFRARDRGVREAHGMGNGGDVKKVGGTGDGAGVKEVGRLQDCGCGRGRQCTGRPGMRR